MERDVQDIADTLVAHVLLAAGYERAEFQWLATPNGTILVLMLPATPVQLSFTTTELAALGSDDAAIDAFVAALERALNG